MDKFLKPLFGLCLGTASITGLLAAGHGGLLSSPWTVPFLVSFAVAVGVMAVRKTAAIRPTRTGALTARRRPPLDRKAAAILAGDIALFALSVTRKMKAPIGTQIEEEQLIFNAMVAMQDSWKIPPGAKPEATLDELRSTHQLIKFGQTIRGTDADLESPYLADVADRDTFLALRDAILKDRAKASALDDAYKAWLAHVGGSTDADHLRKDGWLPFLKSLPGKDIVLWHQIATNFHDIVDPDVLPGVYWILAQPECDRATAAEFLKGISCYHCLQYLAKGVADGGDPWAFEGLRAVIERWNAGFYRQHRLSVEPGEATPEDLTRTRVLEGLTEIARLAKQPPFPEPVGLMDLPAKAPAPRANIWRSSYDYHPGHGLVHRYPGPDGSRRAG